MECIKLSREYRGNIMATSTFFSSSGANSPVDGYVGRTTAGESFSTISDGVGTEATTTAHAMTIALGSAGATPNIFFALRRGIFCFDTSSLPSEAVITAAVVSLYGSSKTNTNGSPDLYITGSTPASTSNLSNSDYENTQDIMFGSIVYASFSTSGYNDITLNGNGIANINYTGISKFAAKLSWDALSSFSGTWTNGGNSSFVTNSSNAPKLTITYVIPPKVQGISSIQGIQSITF